ncbi:GNAT family N-acetyltransferase [Phenylobacterium montanum]|uniref:GNAT family N-acetyltransferase n=1 Tax=Phenylobacterium montanum TaxID=2823693 RepID=A0A975FWB8_9CAUL|nr:GNAT family N-acetyltransferase [Caulobacter sp. S6]QUD86003.1 GNAT family N-acetyltransferase [Caulobacter sp. S6]
MIETARLILRAPVDADRDAIAVLNADPRVGESLGGVRSRAESDALVDRIQACIAKHGYGFWVAERKADGLLVGLIGLLPLEPGDLPLYPGVEIGWRLSPAAWGGGYATEGATAALAWGFANLPVDEIVSFTASTNMKSQAVMRRIGMERDETRDFEHPRLAEGDPLRPHVVFCKRR